MESGAITNDEIDASSTHASCNKNDGRVNVNTGAGAWCAAGATVGDWFEMDLSILYPGGVKISGIGTQGRHGDSPSYPGNSLVSPMQQWVTYYEVMYKNGGGPWTWVADSSGKPRTFEGNKSMLQLKVNRLLDPLPTATRVRIYVRGFYSHPSMRVELYTGSVVVSAPDAMTLSPRDRTVFIRGITLLDEGCGDVRVILESPPAGHTTNPKIHLATTSGITVVDNHGDTRVEFTGPVQAAQAALDRIFFEAPPVSPSTTTMSITVKSHNGATGRGVRAVYYSGHNHDNALKTQVVPTVKGNWATGNPGSPVPSDHFSGRWTGRFIAPVSGTYNFWTKVDDGSRLWVNGVKLLDRWTDQPAYETVCQSISLTAGQSYDLVHEFYENGGYASVVIYWEVPGQIPKQEMPDSVFYMCPIREDTIVMTLNEGTFAPKVTTVPNPPVVTEGLAPTVFNVKLTANPGGIVEVTLRTDDTDQLIFPATSVRFDQTNWNALQAVTVTAVDDFIQETSPRTANLLVGFGVGSGNEGPRVSTGVDTQVTHTFAYVTDAAVSVGVAQVNVDSVAGFGVGDELMMWQVQDDQGNEGYWEFNYVSQVGACGANCITLVLSVKKTFRSGNAHAVSGARVTQIVRVPHFTTLTVATGATVTPPAWDGETGGIVVFRASVEFRMVGTGKIDVYAKGHRGGTCGHCGSATPGYQGEGYPGFGGPYMRSNGQGGGGGYGPSNKLGEPGAGGGCRYYGELGTGYMTQAEGGHAVGDPELERIFFGGGAGAGGDDDYRVPYPEYRHGGGAAVLFAQTIVADSTTLIDVRGMHAIQGLGCSCAAQSGGGAGGTVWITGDVVPTHVPVAATGGDGILDYAVWNVLDYGGGGGDGWVKLDRLDVQPFTAIDNTDPLPVSVVDNDVAAVNLNAAADTIYVTEIASPIKTDTYTVVLNSQPTAPVTVTLLRPAALDEFTTHAASLVFAPASWNVAQAVTVTGIADAPKEPAPQLQTLRHAITSADPFYNVLGDIDKTVTVFAQPTVTKITPPNGGTDEQPLVVVHGSNFNPVALFGTRSVTVGGTTCATPTWLSDTKMTCVVPIGAGTNRNVAVTVNYWPSDDPTAFSYDPPEVTQLDLAEGTTYGAYYITLNGRNFGAATVASRSSKLGGTACQSLAYVSHQRLKCKVPMGVGINKIVRVTVDGQADINSRFFTYLPPEITLVDDDHGPTLDGHTVTIKGHHFGPSGTHTVSIGGTACLAGTTWSTASHTEVVCVAPHGAGAGHAIDLRVDGRTYIAPVRKYNYDPPEVTQLVPPSVPAEGGSIVTINGRNFGQVDWAVQDPSGVGAARPELGPGSISSSMPCVSFTYVSDARITCKVPEGTPYAPAGSAPMVSVTLANQTGPAVGLTYFINWHDQSPKVDIALPGRPIQVSGFGFNVTHEYRCRFTVGAVVVRSAPAVPTSTRDLKCLSPDWPNFKQTFKIDIVDAATDFAHAYTGPISPNPVHTFDEGWIGISPQSGIAGLPTVITFSAGGLNATSGYTCYFDINGYEIAGIGAAAVSSKNVSCTVPESSFSYGGRTAKVILRRDGSPGDVKFYGVFPGDQFEFLIVVPFAPLPPTYSDEKAFELKTHWLPSPIALAGGSTVTRYHLYRDGVKVYDGTDLTFLHTDRFPDTLQPYTIAYENVKGIGAQSPVSSTMTLPSKPIFHAIAPPEGRLEGGQNVTITGIQFGRTFADLLEVKIDFGDCAPIYSWSPTTVVCTTPPGIVAAAAAVTMRTIYGSSTDLKNEPPTDAIVLEGNVLNFIYLSPPNPIEVEPTWTPVYATQAITVRGTKLGRNPTDLSSASLASVPCKSMTWLSEKLFTCNPSPAPSGTPTAGMVAASTTSGGASDSGPLFRYTIPVLDTATPDTVSALGGTIVTLTGYHVGLGFDDIVEVKFGDVAANLNTLTWAVKPGNGESNILTIEAPAQVLTTPVDVYVVTVSGGTNPKGPAVTYYRPGYTMLPPRVTATNPTGSILDGGVLVDLYGTDLGLSQNDLQTVDLVDVSCASPTWISSTHITCVAGSTIDPAIGDPIVFTTSGGLGDSIVKFNYFPARPVIEDVCPKVLSTSGGTVLTVHGRNLGYKQVDHEVTIAGVPCVTTEWISSTMVTCVSREASAMPLGAPLDTVITLYGVSSDPFPSALMHGIACVPSCGCAGECFQPTDGSEPFCVCDSWWTSPPACDIPSVTTELSFPNATEDKPDFPGSVVVSIHQEPKSPVVVTLTLNDTTEANANPGTLTFVAAGWDTPQTVAIEAVYDELRDGDQRVTVMTESVSEDPKFNGIPVPSVELTVLESSPLIDHIEPEVHPLNGTTVTIEGRNFDPWASAQFDLVLIGANVTRMLHRGNYTHIVAPPPHGSPAIDGSEITDSGNTGGARRVRRRGLSRHQGLRDGISVDDGNGGDRAVKVMQGSGDDVVAIRTVSPPMPPGYADVWIVNAGGTRGVRLKGVFFTEDCPTPGTFGRGLDCQPCPEGAVCPGGYRLWPKDGYWNPGEDAGYVYACKPPESCVAGKAGTCGEGYAGEKCAVCDRDYYKDAADVCHACPSYFVLSLLLLSDIIIWILLAIAGITLRSYENVSHIVMFIMSVQQISGVGRMLGDRSPRVLREIYEILKLFEGDYNYVKPDCLGMPPGYDLTFVIQLIYSLAIGIPIVGIVPLARWCSDKYHERHGPEVVAERHRFYSMRMVRMFTIWLLVIYLPLTGNAYRAVSCITVGGEPVLLTDPSTECYTQGHKIITFLASLIIIFLTIGFPATYTYKILKNRDLMHDDMKFAEKLNFFYEPFKPRYWFLYFFEIITLNGIALSDATTSDPTKQLYSLLALFGVQLLTMLLFRPYHRSWEGWLMTLFNITNIIAVVYNYFTQTNFMEDSQLRLIEWPLVALVMLCLIISAGVVVYFVWIVHTPRNSVFGHDYFISKAITRSIKFGDRMAITLADDIDFDEDMVLRSGHKGRGSDDESGSGGSDASVDGATPPGESHGSGKARNGGVAIGALLGASAAAAVAKKRQKRVKRKKTALTPGVAPPQRKVRRTSIDSNGDEVQVSEYEDVPLDEIDFSDEYVYTDAGSDDDDAGAGGGGGGGRSNMTGGRGKFSMGSSDAVDRQKRQANREKLVASIPAFAMPTLAVPGPSRYGTEFIDSSSDGDSGRAEEVRMLVDAEDDDEMDWGFGVLWDDPALLHQMYGASVVQFEELTNGVIDRSRRPADDYVELEAREIDVTSVTKDPDPRKVFEINSTYLNRRIQQCLFRMVLGLEFVRYLPKYRGLAPEELPSNVALDVPQEPIIKRLIMPWGQQNFAGVGTLAEMCDGVVMEIASKAKQRLLQSLDDKGFAVLSDVTVRNIDFPHKRALIISLYC